MSLIAGKCVVVGCHYNGQVLTSIPVKRETTSNVKTDHQYDLSH